MVLTTPSFGNIESANKVMEGVYTAEGTTPAGEKIYFGMERLDRDSLPRWGLFADLCYRALQDFPRGPLYEAGFHINNPSLLRELKISQTCGFDEGEFSDLLSKLRAREICRGGKRWKGFNEIRLAIAGFAPYEGMDLENNGGSGFAPLIGSYVAYVSKSPIKGRASIPQVLTLSMKNISQVYQDILMCVGVKLMDKKSVFRNRGIFRNPFSFIEGGYSNIASRLHTFTGRVMKDFINADLNLEAKEFMTVSPLKEMENILIKEVGRDRVKIDREIPSELYFPEGEGVEKPLLIALSDLVKLYC